MESNLSPVEQPSFPDHPANERIEVDSLEEHEEEAGDEEEVDGDGEDPAEAQVAVVDAGWNEAEVSAQQRDLHVLESSKELCLEAQVNKS